MTYRELIHKSARLLNRRKITVDEYEEMTKPLDRDVEYLDKIRAEVTNLTDGQIPERIWNIDVLQIIDKYMEESEE